MADWFDWHLAYDDPTSDLSRRLLAVQGQIVAALDRAPPGPVRAISICAGQGRDLLGVLPGHPRRVDVSARLVELDRADAARAAAVDGVEVATGDGSVTTAYEGMVPAHLVLICGVFDRLVAPPRPYQNGVRLFTFLHPAPAGIRHPEEAV